MAHSEVLLKSTLEPFQRELAVLAVTAVFKAPYVAYAHRRMGMEQGLSELQVDQALEVLVPEDLSEDQVVYQTALALAGTWAPLDQKTWDRAEKVLGREKVAKLGMVVGWYVHISMLLNLGAVGAPTE